MSASGLCSDDVRWVADRGSQNGRDRRESEGQPVRLCSHSAIIEGLRMVVNCGTACEISDHIVVLLVDDAVRGRDGSIRVER